MVFLFFGWINLKFSNSNDVPKIWVDLDNSKSLIKESLCLLTEK